MEQKTLKRLNEIKEKRQIRKDGGFNVIPWYEHFPKLSKHIPGLIPGTITTLFASTGCGKSKMSRMLTILIPYMLYNKYNIPFHTIYLALEESEEELIDNLCLTIVFLKHNISIDYMTLSSFKEDILSDKELLAIEDVMLNDIPKILEHVTIVDDVYNPTGCYLAVKKKAEELGKIIKEEKEFENKNGTIEKANVFSRYELNDPRMNVIVAMDHQQILQGEYDNINNKYIDQTGAISRWSTYYCKNYITKKFKFTCLNIGQEKFAAQDIEHFKQGKLEPSLEGLGDNKLVLRDSALVIALFNPQNHEMKNHRKYDMIQLKNEYISFHVLKSRFGIKNLQAGLRFYGAAGWFEELPQAGTPEMEQYYRSLKN